MARLAHKMAVESPRVTAEVVEISEFPFLAQKYRVMGVPKTIINDKVEVEGAVPEPTFLQQLEAATSS